MMVSSITFAQTVQSYALKIGIWNDHGEQWDWSETDKTDVVIEIKDSYLFFDNELKTVIRTFGEVTEGVGYVSWDAVDDKGVNCGLMMFIGEKPNTIVIMYESYCVVYYVTY